MRPFVFASVFVINCVAVLAGSLYGQGDLPGDAISALQAKCVEAIQRAEGSVVSIARVSRDGNAGGFQLPNLGRLSPNSRVEDAFPTDEDFVPVDFGAGVVIDGSPASATKPAGGSLIVTTYHLLGDAAASEYFVWSRHRPYKATIVAADGWFDLAVLSVDAKDLKPMPFGDAKAVKKGEFAIALGNPQAIARDGDVSATWGMISNLQRRAPHVPERVTAGNSRETLHHYGTLIQFDRPLQLGYSGGALVNLQGEMIGLMTAYTGIASVEQAAGFAIPVDEYFQQALTPLKSGKSPAFGFLGVGLEPLDVQVRRQGRHGATVASVMVGSPAARADIRVGDVITHFEGVPLYDDDDLIREVSRLPPERTVKLALLRTPNPPAATPFAHGQPIEKSAVLTRRAGISIRPAVATVLPPSWRGMRIDDATAAPREAWLSTQLPAHGGLYITAVEADSPVWRVGLRAGQFITAVEGQPTTTSREFFALVEQLGGDVRLTTLVPGGGTKDESVSP